MDLYVGTAHGDVLILGSDDSGGTEAHIRVRVRPGETAFGKTYAELKQGGILTLSPGSKVARWKSNKPAT